MNALSIDHLQKSVPIDLHHEADHQLELRPLFEGIDWSLELLGAKLEIVIRDLDRFSAARDEPECLEWFDRLVEGLVSLDDETSSISVLDYPFERKSEVDFVDYLIDQSDWLTGQAQVVFEVFQDERLGMRLEGLAGACFDTAREILLSRPNWSQ